MFFLQRLESPVYPTIYEYSLVDEIFIQALSMVIIMKWNARSLGQDLNLARRDYFLLWLLLFQPSKKY